jgi:hypothetical protein
MKKTLGIIVICFMLAIIFPLNAVNAQLFDEGDIVISAGLGLGSNYYGLGGTSLVMPVIFASGDYCLREDLGPGNLGIGAIIGYSSYKDNFYLSDNYYWRVNTLMIGARGTYHFTDLVDNLDLYGGITLGGKVVTTKSSDAYLDAYSSSAGSGLLSELFAGGRYYFSDNFAGMAELGYGISWLKIGLSLKL